MDNLVKEQLQLNSPLRDVPNQVYLRMILKRMYLIGTSLGLLIFCQNCTPIKVETALPEANPAIIPSTLPEKVREVIFSPIPTSSSILPSLSPTLEPSLLTPILNPTQTPIPLKRNSRCSILRTTLEGKVKITGDSLRKIDVAKELLFLSETTVIAKSLDPLIPYISTTEVKERFYRLENIPLNTPLEIKVFKKNHLAKRRIVTSISYFLTIFPLFSFIYFIFPMERR